MTKQTKNEPKFTPGPWSIEKSEYPDGAGYFYINAKDKNIGGDVIVFQGINNMANAALIAAAPEMYEVLERAYTALWDDGYMDNKSQKLRADISTVLAKARGEDAK